MMLHGVTYHGTYGLDVYNGPVLEARRRFHNGLTQVGIHDNLDTYFSNGSTAAAWYFFLIANDGFDSVATTDTMSSHAGWTEITSEYDEATRPVWGPDNAASLTKANSTKATVTINATVDIKGLGLASDNTKGGASGILWGTGILDIIQTVQPGRTLKLFYSLLAQEG